MAKAIFFDMQGTLGGEGTGDIRDFSFYPFSINATKLAKENGFLTIVVTNQSNIGRNKLTIADFDNKVKRLQSELEREGASFDDVLCCPHITEDNCKCKKPKTELIDEAVNKHGTNINDSFVIGDMGNSDMMGKEVGAKAILVLTGVGNGSMIGIAT